MQPPAGGLLDRYHRVARGLHRARALLVVGLLAGLAAFALGLFDLLPALGGSRILLPVLVTLWCLAMLVFAFAFRNDVPVAAPGSGLGRRLATALHRFGLHLLALALIALGAAALLLSLRAVAILAGSDV